jgi:hypothetical protein
MDPNSRTRIENYLTYAEELGLKVALASPPASDEQSCRKNQPNQDVAFKVIRTALHE